MAKYNFLFKLGKKDRRDDNRNSLLICNLFTKDKLSFANFTVR